MRPASWLLLLLCLDAARAGEPKPVGGPMGLAAGGGPPGAADGTFGEARFRAPKGLALDEGGKVLWVCDSGNLRLRRVDLAKGFEVSSPFPKLDLGGAPDEVAVYRPGLLLVLSDNGKKLFSVSTSNGEAKVLRSGSALRNLLTGGPGNRILALEEGTGKILELPAPGSTAKPKPVLDGKEKGFSGLAAFKDGYYAYRPVGTQMVRLGGDQALTIVEKTDVLVDGALAPVTQIPTLSFRLLGGADLEPGLDRLYFWQAGSDLVCHMDPPNTLLTYIYLPNFYGWDMNHPVNIGRPYSQVGGLALDTATRTLYLSDPKNNRVLWLRDFAFERKYFGMGTAEFANDFGHVQAKPKDCKRVLCYGSSYSFFAHNQELGRWDSLFKHMERFLNLKSAAAGEGLTYEALCDGRTLETGSAGSDVLSQAFLGVQRKGVYGPDLCLVFLYPADLAWTLLYGFRHYSVEELGLSPEDGAVFRALGNRLVADLKARRALYGRDITLIENDVPALDLMESDVYRLYTDPEFKSMLEDSALFFLGLARKKLKESAPHCPMAVAFCPARNFLGFQSTGDEMRFHKMETVPYFDTAVLEKRIKALGASFYDLDSMMKGVAVSLHPLFWSHDDHLSTAGTQTAGFFAAESAWKDLHP